MSGIIGPIEPDSERNAVIVSPQGRPVTRTEDGVLELTPYESLKFEEQMAFQWSVLNCQQSNPEILQQLFSPARRERLLAIAAETIAQLVERRGEEAAKEAVEMGIDGLKQRKIIEQVGRDGAGDPIVSLHLNRVTRSEISVSIKDRS